MKLMGSSSRQLALADFVASSATLRGNGWLLEAPRAHPARKPERWTKEQEAARRELKKCIFIPPLRDWEKPLKRIKRPVPIASKMTDRDAWWHDPVAVGTFLAVFPPLGFTLLWASPRYSRDARWAISILTVVMMTLVATVATVALVVAS